MSPKAFLASKDRRARLGRRKRSKSEEEKLSNTIRSTKAKLDEERGLPSSINQFRRRTFPLFPALFEAGVKIDAEGNFSPDLP